ncbi:complement decay-accelerating factor, GPI-anchored isoform X3 [Anarrhichthys ocellatus]|uniref:complement decay-accelerating factor, GPI-anchored isoform X3 n=1 Tax=Anarrhichthys ocellatus TaxID=433405 RepID=UPI0012EDB541|nr:complement decay-accelerating factor, GPI-anchored-like isoform X3 [Anarrhichthys ocellatus]
MKRAILFSFPAMLTSAVNLTHIMDSSVLVRSGRSTVDRQRSGSRLRRTRTDRDRTWIFSLLLQPGMDVLLDTCGRRRVKFPLLLYLFVVEAAADCPKPQARENIVLTNEALLMNDFPEGVVVTLECANGFVVESGFGSITCTNNNWNEPDLSCKKKDCGPPSPQLNMSFNTSDGTLFGAVIKVVCDKGFQIIGTSYRQCYATGWSRKSRCKIVTCKKPSTVTNGKHSWDSEDDPKYGEIIQYVCNEGYALVGNDSIVCSETRDYDSRPPACQEVSTSTDPSATLTAHRDKTVTTSATPTVSPSVQGGRDISTAAGNATTTAETSTTSSSLPEYIPVIVSVICVSIAVCVVAVFLHKFLLRRKGSYDTREDLKPELLQFQNL